jgi:Fur family peroxide stress response transcriptional regulator
MQNSQKTDTAIINALRSKGYKATPQRIAISKIALSSHEHPNIQKIYREVRKHHSTVSLATVYKTLQILQETGLIQELSFPQGQTRYDPYIKPHINLVCLQCGKIQDIEDSALNDLIQKVASNAHFTLTSQRVDIYGICNKCAKPAS